MTPQVVSDRCEVCGGDLPADPPSVVVPARPGVRLSPLAAPGVVELAFCCERHRRDWADGQRGEWPADRGA